MGSLDSTASAVATAVAAGWPDGDVVRLLVSCIHDFDTIDDRFAQEEFLREPRLTGDPGWDAALAALAIHLARRAGLSRTPDWTRTPERYTRNFRWIGLAADSGLKAYVFQRTPVYFKSRGVMLNVANLESV